MTAKKDPTALAAAYARGRASADALANVTDELNSKIAEAETSLAALKLGVRASVLIREDTNSETGLSWYSHLSFGKWEKSWRLLYETSSDFHDEVETTPLTNASREVRLQAIDVMPDLLLAMVESAEKEADEVKSKLDALGEFVELTKSMAKGA